MKTGSILVCIQGLVLAWGLLISARVQVTQEWVARYNGSDNLDDIASCVVVDDSGNVYVTGWSQAIGEYLPKDYATIKYNAAGQQQWVTRYNGPGNYDDYATSLAVDRFGNVYVTGASYGGGTTFFDYATIKYSAAGQQQWVARYNGPGGGYFEGANSLAVDSNGNIYVTGFSYRSGLGDDYTTIKYNADGTQQWVARYNGPGDSTDVATSLVLDGHCNVYVTGYSAQNLPPPYAYDYATVKYDSSGNQLWVARYNGPWNNDDEASSLAVDDFGNVYVTGYSYVIGYVTIKYNSIGQQQWVASYDGLGGYQDKASSLVLDGQSNVYVTGWSSGESGTGPYDYATIKYNADGVQQWVARYDGPNNGDDEAHSLAVDGNGNVYVTGYSDGIVTGDDYATIKYDSGGQQQWLARYNGSENGGGWFNCLALDGDGNVYVTGSSSGFETGLNYTTVKYSQEQAVDPWATEVPHEFALKGAVPNPFNSSTVLSYELRVPSQMKLTVWDLSGRLVTTLVNGRQTAGEHSATFDGSGLASGIYLAKLQAGVFTATQKLVLLK